MFNSPVTSKDQPPTPQLDPPMVPTPIVPNTATILTPEITRVTVKPPQFFKNAPELYFMQMEAQFNLAGISRDTTKFNHILGSLDPAYLSTAMDVLRAPPETNKYDTLKHRIIGEFQQSDQHKLRILLRDIELGDLKPSQLLRKMRELSKDSMTDDALKTLWIERLPEQIRPVVSICEGGLLKLAETADKMLEITSYNSISAVASSTTNNIPDKSFAMIEALTKQVSELSNRFERFSGNRGRSNSRDERRGRARSTSRPKNSRYCYYHHKFGALARKCIDPCQYKPESATNSEQKN